jgi:hypothetical protein
MRKLVQWITSPTRLQRDRRGKVSSKIFGGSHLLQIKLAGSSLLQTRVPTARGKGYGWANNLEPGAVKLYIRSCLGPAGEYSFSSKSQVFETFERRLVHQVPVLPLHVPYIVTIDKLKTQWMLHQ